MAITEATPRVVTEQPQFKTRRATWFITLGNSRSWVESWRPRVNLRTCSAAHWLLSNARTVVHPIPTSSLRMLRTRRNTYREQTVVLGRKWTRWSSVRHPARRDSKHPCKSTISTFVETSWHKCRVRMLPKKWSRSVVARTRTWEELKIIIRIFSMDRMRGCKLEVANSNSSGLWVGRGKDKTSLDNSPQSMASHTQLRCYQKALMATMLHWIFTSPGIWLQIYRDLKRPRKILRLFSSSLAIREPQALSTKTVRK